MKKLILLIVCLAVSAIVFAQAPDSFKYQAVARDAAGNVLQNQSITFKFSILRGSASGTVAYSERHSLTTNDFGLVNLTIGTGTNKVGSISTIPWGYNSYFLKVEMDPAGGTAYKLVDTSQMLSVPYALHAQTSEGGGLTLPFAGNTDASNYGLWVSHDLTSGSSNGIIGSSSSDEGIGVKGEATAAAGITYGVRGVSFSTDGVGVYGSGFAGLYGLTNNADGYAVSGKCTSLAGQGRAVMGIVNSPDAYSGYFYGGKFYVYGNVGIGIPYPVYKLHVSSYVSSSWLSGFHNTSLLPTGNGLVVRADGGSPFLVQGNAGSTIMSVQQNGRIGIGTKSPGEKLEIFGNGSISGMRVRFSSGYSSLFGEFLHAGSGGLIINAEAGGGSWGKMFLQTNGTNRVYIASNGRVGIGATDPSQLLDVNGKIRSRGITTATMTTGDVYRTGDGTLVSVGSDIRLKENIKPLEKSLDKVRKLRGVSFTWKADPDHNQSIGFIAQELEKVIPELVFTNPNDGYKGINYGEISAVLAEAIKELNVENDRLKEENIEIKERLARIEAIMAAGGSKQ